MSDLRRVIGTSVAGLVALVNLVTFRASESDLARQHHALRRSASASLLHLTVESGLTVQARFWLEVWLRERAPGVRVVVAADVPLDAGALVGIGRAEVEVRGYEALIDGPTAARLESRAVVSGPRRSERRKDPSGAPVEYGTFAVVAPRDWDGETGRLLAYHLDGRVFLVEETVASRLGMAVPR